MAAGSPDTLSQSSTRRAKVRGAPAGRLSKPQGDMWEIPFAGEDLAELRALVSAWASRQAMGPEPTDELVLSVHELATNSVRHGGGVGMLRLWRAGAELVCEVEDAGRMRDAGLGEHQPGTAPAESRGLWIARQLCDRVQIRCHGAGTQVRLHKRLV
jgi:anti-sigma regulatory factor (Ser/Thr protein kinase)